MKREFYIVYLNKSFDVWLRDGMKFAEINGLNVPENNSHNIVISEVVFHHHLQNKLIGNTPCYFVTEMLTEH